MMDNTGFMRAIRSATLCFGIIGASAFTAVAAFAETTVVILIDLEPGKPIDEVVKAIKTVAAFVKKQPGFVQGDLLQSTIPNNKPAYVHIMRWDKLDDWANVSGNPEFQKVLEANSPYFIIRPAEVFVQVN
jgi:heme-degrading monooxygenase HmoA